MSINERIKILRAKLKINQTEFASKIGVTQPSLSDIEKGKTQNISNRNIKLICSVFGVREEWLLNGEGDMFRNEENLISLLGDKLDELDETDKKIIVEYLRLSPKQRKIMKDYLKKIF